MQHAAVLPVIGDAHFIVFEREVRIARLTTQLQLVLILVVDSGTMQLVGYDHL